MNTLKRCLPDVVAVLLFVILSFAYFFPADFEGRILYRHDSSAGVGAGQEILDYMDRHDGERPRWTNSLFSGMPTYQLTPTYDTTKALGKVENAYHLWLPENVWLLFVYLLGFYILLRAFDFRQHLAALGSVIWAFSTYFLIIIAAGHIWKVIALAYLPPLIAGVVLAYRGKYMKGLFVTALFAALEVSANHVQMTYYYLFIIFFMALAWLADAIRKKQLAHWLKATGVCIVGGLIGLLVNLSNLYHTWEYSKESMRGKSELVKEQSENQTSSGLDRDYITGYSYGIGETWSLLVPNVKGGASDRVLGATSVGQKEGNSHFLNANGQQIPYSYIYNQMPQYWNESTLDRQQPGTSGPVYVGAFVLMLFVLGLFIVRSPLKWALLAATVLSILLAWGQNLMWFSNIFIDYVPMYAKFRTVESILVIAEFCIPLLAMLTLKQIVEEPQVLTQKIKYVYASFAVTGGVCLLFALMPSVFFNFTTGTEMNQFNEMMGSQAGAFMQNLQDVRKSIFTADCWRSFIIIVVGTLLLLFYKARKLQAPYLVAALFVLCLVDLWQVNKRYLNDEMFVPKSERETAQPQTLADQQILQDKALDYRVLNVSEGLGMVFNDNSTSYYHKSIGGYHAAKLRRYQELIDAYLMREAATVEQAVPKLGYDLSVYPTDSLIPVLNMLNTKYVIVRGQNQQPMAVQNPGAFGNAWFVDHVKFVKNANEEIDAIGRLSLRHEAVADEKFSSVLGESVEQDSTSTAVITSYDANLLTYDVKSAKGGVLVFSEIYYPGWTATIDGKPAELGRVNYVLRALKVEPGQHKVELAFFPKSVKTTETIAWTALGVLLLLLVAVVAFEVVRRKRQ